MAEKVYTTEEIKTIIEPIAKAYGAGKISLFGSYARGEATKHSDVDLHLIDRGNIRGLFKMSGFQLDLEEKLGVHVDLLPHDTQNGLLLSKIKSDEVIIYEQ